MSVQLGAALLQERNRLGLTQEQMAEAGGVKKRTYCYYEKGERAPSAEFMSAIKKVGVDVSFLLFGVREFSSLINEDPSEETLLSLYRQATPEGRRSIVFHALDVASPELSETLLAVAAANKPGSIESNTQVAVLTPEEMALLDNFRNSPPEGKTAIKTTSAALAKSSGMKKKAG